MFCLLLCNISWFLPRLPSSLLEDAVTRTKVYCMSLWDTCFNDWSSHVVLWVKTSSVLLRQQISQKVTERENSLVSDWWKMVNVMTLFTKYKYLLPTANNCLIYHEGNCSFTFKQHLQLMISQKVSFDFSLWKKK